MRRKQRLFLALALFMTLTACLYCTIFADFSFGMEICFGIASVILYVLINLIPYFTMRRKNAGLSLPAYLKKYINEIITKE
ncbi:MAG: hypothetical protein ACI4A7_07340 [Prevotella sp.]